MWFVYLKDPVIYRSKNYQLELVYLPEGKYWVYPRNGLQAGQFDAPGIMSAVSLAFLVEVSYSLKGYLMLYYPYM